MIIDWLHENEHVIDGPGMRFVVDAGRSKQKILEEGGSLAQYDVRWISKASAQQRAGRSGRTGPGHCYRSVLQGFCPAMSLLPCHVSLAHCRGPLLCHVASLLMSVYRLDISSAATALCFDPLPSREQR